MTTRRVPLVLLGTLILGCSGQADGTFPSGAPPGFRNAYAAPNCAPWDGYAVSLVLRDDALSPTDSAIENTDQRHLQLHLYPRTDRGLSPSGLAPGVFQWPHDPNEASGVLCENGACEDIPSGRIRIDAVSPNGDFSGSVNLHLENADSIRGGYRATWRHREMLCG
jgi:hypothetical protein